MFFGGLDVGTTGCKIAVYDENGVLFKTYYKEYEVKHKNGLHEIDFNDVKNGVTEILKCAANECELTALGVTSFGETFAMLDENDNILDSSMLYTDPRGQEQCDYLCESLGSEKLSLITGVKPNPMYSISKIMWQRDNNAEKFGKCKKILLGEDFIVYILTGKAVIDYSLAARTGAFDIRNKCWHKEIFDAAKINLNLLSKPVETGYVAGKITDSIKEVLGIDYDITIVCGGHDQIANMVGAGVFESSQAMDGTGTVECIPVVFDKVPDNMKLYEDGYSVVPFVDDKYACYALSFTGGATLKWFRDEFAQTEYKQAESDGKNIYAVFDSMVCDKPTGILVMPHFSGAATPYMNTSSKAAFVGITLETTKYDLYKALMEGTSYEMLLNFSILKEYCGEISEIRATGGGASSDVWLQIKADILGSDILSLSCKEVGATGAAAIAGVSTGVFKDLKSAVPCLTMVRRRFVCDRSKHEIYQKYYNKYKDLYAAIMGLGGK